MSFDFSNRTFKIVFAVLAAALIIAPVSYLIITAKHNVTVEKHSIVLGPEVHVIPALIGEPAYSSTAGTGNTSLNYSNMTVSVQIYSVVPSILKNRHFTSLSSGMPESSYARELLNESFTMGDNATFFLNPSFYNISNQWLSILGNGSAKISMTIEAYLSYSNGSNMSLYTYYNNILYGPNQKTIEYYEPYNQSLASNLSDLNVPVQNVSNITMGMSQFNVSIEFNLSNPFETLDIPSENVSGLNTSSSENPANYYCTSDGSGQYTTSTLAQLSVLTGPLPLLSDYMNITEASKDASNYPYSEIDMGATFNAGDITFSMNSSQAEKTTGGSVTMQMSTTPTYDNNLPVIENLSLWTAIPATVNMSRNTSYPGDLNNTFGVIYIENAKFTVSVYEIYTHHWNKFKCYNNGQQYIEWQNSTSYSGNETDVHVSNLQTTYGNKSGIALNAGNLSQYMMTARSEDGYSDLIDVSQSNSSKVNMSQASPAYWMHLYESLGVLMNHIFNPSDNISEPVNLGHLTTSGVNKSRNAQQIWYSASGYSTLNSVLKNAQNEFDTFAAGLGVASAIIDLAAAADVMDDTTAAIISSTIEVIKSELELSARIMADFNSISFTSNTELVSSMIEISNYPEFNGGTPFNIFDYQSNLPMNVVIQGTHYTYYTPADVIFSYLNSTPTGYATYNWTAGAYS